MDPLPGQGVTGALNWALDLQIPRTLVNRCTRARHPATERVNSMPSRVELALTAARLELGFEAVMAVPSSLETAVWTRGESAQSRCPLVERRPRAAPRRPRPSARI